MRPRRFALALVLLPVFLAGIAAPASSREQKPFAAGPSAVSSGGDPEILSLVDSLSHGDDLERAQVAFSLRSMGPRIIPALLDRLPLIDAKGASWIVTLLAEYPGRNIDAMLEQCLHHADVRVRCSAATALDRRGNAPREMVKEVLQKGTSVERRMAVEQVASASDTESLAALCRSLRDQDWLVRARARRSLLEKLEEVDARGEGAWLTDQLLDYHRSPLPGPRTDLIAVLGHRTGSRVEEVLMRVLEVPDPQERQAAVSALSRHHREELLPSFLRMAAMDPVASVRREAVRALQDHGSPEVILPLIERLRDPDGGVRAEAYEGLVRLSGVDHGQHYWSWVEWSKVLSGSSDGETISP